jgi:regulator of RNase E activity RraA
VGELTTYCAHRKGLAGIVIDGALRDAAKIARSPLPVYARAVVPNGGGAEYLGEINVTVSCGGQVVHPGDWIIGDRDGVVVVPAEQLEDTLALAARIVKAEKVLERQILKGADLGTLLRAGEKIERKRGEIFIPQLRAEIPEER